MSCFLGKNKAKRSGPPRGSIAVGGSSFRAATSSSNKMMARVSGGGQGQALLQMSRQRPVAQQNQASNQQTGVSLEEVMKDLQVLEQQQKEAQRKLQKVRETRNQRDLQRLSLEGTFKACKYSNGQQRVQLQKVRGSLLEGQDMMWRQRCRGERASNEIRAFHSALNEAFKAVRINNEYRRKIEIQLIFSTTKADTLIRLKNDALEKPRKLEKKRDQAKHKLETLQRDVQAKVAKSREYSDQVTSARSDISSLEQELAKAQQTEGATKLNTQNLSKEIETSIENHNGAIEAVVEKMKSCDQAKQAHGELKKTTQSKMDEARQQIDVLLERLSQIQKNEAQDPTIKEALAAVAEAASGGKTLAAIESSLSETEAALCRTQKDKENVLQSIKNLRTKEIDLQQQERAMSLKITEISKASHAARLGETKRRKNLDKCLEELDVAKKGSESLHKAFSDINMSRVEHRTQSNKKAQALKEAVEKENEEIASLSETLDAKKSSIDLFKVSWSNAKRENESKISKLKQLSKEAEDEREVAEDAMKKATPEEESHLPLEQKKREEIKKTKRASDVVARLLKEHEELKGVPFIYDPTMTSDQQAEASLEGLVAACKGAIEDAKQKFEKTETAEINRKRNLLDEQERRKEEARRDKEQKEAIEIQRRLELKRELEREAQRKKEQKEAIETRLEEEAQELERKKAEELKRQARREKERKEAIEAQRREAQKMERKEVEDLQSEATMQWQAERLGKTSGRKEEINWEGFEAEDSEADEENPDQQIRRGHKKHSEVGAWNKTRDESLLNSTEATHTSSPFTRPDLERYSTPKQSSLQRRSPNQTQSSGYEKRVRFEGESDTESLSEPEVMEPKKRDRKTRNQRQFTSSKSRSSREVTKTTMTGGDYGSRSSRDMFKSRDDKRQTKRKSHDNSEGGVLAGLGSTKKGAFKRFTASEYSLSGTGSFGGTLGSTGTQQHSRGTGNRKKLIASFTTALKTPIDNTSVARVVTDKQSKSKKRHRLSFSSVPGQSKAPKPSQSKQGMKNPRPQSTGKTSGASMSKTSTNKKSSSSSNKRPLGREPGTSTSKTSKTSKMDNVPKRRRKKKKDIMGVSRAPASSFCEDYEFKF